MAVFWRRQLNKRLADGKDRDRTELLQEMLRLLDDHREDYMQLMERAEKGERQIADIDFEAARLRKELGE